MLRVQKKFQRILVLMISMVFILSQHGWLLAAEQGASEDVTSMAADIAVSDNSHAQNYERWASVVNSYLELTASGYMRVEYINRMKQVVVEEYDREYKLITTRKIELPLEKFGGFFKGESGYYLVCGQDNPAETDDTEVMRVMKYDWNWNYIAAASLCGANTYKIFAAGSLRMTEADGHLYIRTAHEMYRSTDGRHHQSCMTVEINEDTMTIEEAFYKVWNIGGGYVSHSFNQFILVDDQKDLVAVDHGDAYPRSVVLGKYEKKAGQTGFISGYDYTEALPIAGDVGNNVTGVTVGGVGYSRQNYLIAGTTVDQEKGDLSAQQNIYLAVIDQKTMNTERRMLTDIEAGKRVSTPQLVRMGEDRFLLMWEVYSTSTVDYYYQGAQKRSAEKICYVWLDGAGEMLTAIQTADGMLSDCQPVVSDQSVVWYVTDGEQIFFYQLDPEKGCTKKCGHIAWEQPKIRFKENEVECALLKGTFYNPVEVETDGKISYSSDKEEIATVDQAGTVTMHKSGSCTITIKTSESKNYAAGEASYHLQIKDLLLQEIEVDQQEIECEYGQEIQIHASSTYGEKISFTSDDEKVVKVNEDGVVQAVGVGNATIYLTAAGSENYDAATLQIDVRVYARGLEGCKYYVTSRKITEENANNFFVVMDHDTVLQEGQDYIVDQEQDPGADRVILYGIGNYQRIMIIDREALRPAEMQIMKYTTMSKEQFEDIPGSEKGGIFIWWHDQQGCIGSELYREDKDGKQCIARMTGNGQFGSQAQYFDMDMAWDKNDQCRYSIRTISTDGVHEIYSDFSEDIVIERMENDLQCYLKNKVDGLYEVGDEDEIGISGATGEVKIYSENEKIAKVSKEGRLQAIAKGSTKIHVVAGGDRIVKEKDVVVPVTVRSADPSGPSEPEIPVDLESTEYQIRFYKNHAKATGSMATKTVPVKDNVRLTKNKYQLAGYTFAGWSLSKNGTVKWKDQATIKAKSMKAGSIVRLYAKWKKVTVKKTTIQKVVSTKKRQAKVSWKKTDQAEGYQIITATKKDFKTNKKTYTIKSSKATNYTLKDLHSGKKYYVKVVAFRVDSKGKKILGKYNTIKTVKVK